MMKRKKIKLENILKRVPKISKSTYLIHSGVAFIHIQFLTLCARILRGGNGWRQWEDIP